MTSKISHGPILSEENQGTAVLELDRERKTHLQQEQLPSSTPESFLAKCKALVEGMNAPVKAVPLALRHRVQQFRPRARAICLKRRLRLLSPHWNEKSANKLEKILGCILLACGGLLLLLEISGKDEVQPTIELSSDTLHSGPDNSTFNIVYSSAAPELVEIPFLDEAAINPSVLREMAPQSNPQSYSRFHSYANPATRFVFEDNLNRKANYQISSLAACGVAQHFQHSMPVILRRGNQPAWTSAGSEQESNAKRISTHPLLQRMMRQVRQVAFQNYVEAGPSKIGSVPMTRVTSQFQNFAQVLKEACGSAPAPESEQEE